MKMKFDIRSLVCGALVGVAIVLLTGAAGEGQKGWEYTRVYYGRGNQAPMEELNKLGEQGWEMSVALTSDGVTHGFVFSALPILLLRPEHAVIPHVDSNDVFNLVVGSVSSFFQSPQYLY
jgi:hypothetical protein